MPRLLFPLVALLAMLCTAPLYAQDDAPAEHELIGTWVGLTMDGEELEEGDFVLVFNADDTGSINEGGDRPEPFTYTYDADTQRCVIFFDGDEDDAFPIDVTIDGDTATFAPEDEDILVARRVPADGDDADAPMPDGDQPAGAIPPPPAPVDTSDSPLLGRWMLVQFNDEPVPDGLVAYDHRADGTGQVIEEGEPGNTFGWQHDMERGAVVVQTPEGETLTFYVVLFEDLAIYFADPSHGDMRIVHRRMPEPGAVGEAGEDAPAEPDAAPMVGQWAGVSDNGEPVPAGESVTLTFHADGTGEVVETELDDTSAFTWSYNAAAEVCTITVDGDRMKFLVSFDGDTMTFESEDADMVLVMRRVAAQGEDAAEGEDDRADAEFPEGPLGTWYAQQMYHEWVHVDEEMRIEFREDGRVYTFMQGEAGDDSATYRIVEDRRVIQIFERDGELEVEMAYDLFDDVMVLTIQVPEEAREDFDPELGDEIELVLCRRPEGTEEHQRMRRAVEAGHPVNGETPRHRARKMQSATQLRGIHQGLVTYAVSQDDFYPDNFGVLLPGDFLTAEYLLAPWSEVEVPGDIDDWSDEEQAAWSLANTSYVFVLGGEKLSMDTEIVALFELPIYEGTETIAVCFDDNHVERLPYDEADDLIEEQTGRNLMGWMDHLGREQIAVEETPHDHAEEDHDHD